MIEDTRKARAAIFGLAGCAFVFLSMACSAADPGIPGSGQTTIAKWKDDKKGAFSLTFDDSSTSEADIAVPAMIQRGLVGSWYINPGHPRYFDPAYDPCHDDIPNCPYVCKESRRSTWEVDALNSGQELANHTWDHGGWADCAQADNEIGECARYIRALTGKPNSLLSFTRPGGVTIDCADLAAILDKYNCIEREPTFSGGPVGDMIVYAQGAIDAGEWRKVLYHHVDGETGYKPVACADFLQFLDWLVTQKGSLWIATYIDAYKYSRERDTGEVTVIESTSDLVRLDLTSTMDALLYDQPLTLITDVPEAWDACRVTQSGQAKVYPIAVKGKVRYEAVPNKGEIRLSGD